jgi:hypothetical protein
MVFVLDDPLASDDASRSGSLTELRSGSVEVSAANGSG